MMKLVFGLLVMCLLVSCCTGQKRPWSRGRGGGGLSEENTRVKRDTSLTNRFMSFACGKLCASEDGSCLFERICGPYRRKFKHLLFSSPEPKAHR